MLLSSRKPFMRNSFCCPICSNLLRATPEVLASNTTIEVQTILLKLQPRICMRFDVHTEKKCFWEDDLLNLMTLVDWHSDHLQEPAIAFCIWGQCWRTIPLHLSFAQPIQFVRESPVPSHKILTSHTKHSYPPTTFFPENYLVLRRPLSSLLVNEPHLQIRE